MSDEGLVVAVTGPTGEIGVPFIRALEQVDGIAEIRGMARSPFDPASRGWARTTYVQGDILDRDAVDRFVRGADVVVHLAFIIFGDNAKRTREINLEGSRNVFESAVEQGASRLLYTSSIAAYGFDEGRTLPLTEDASTLGSERFYYASQKAELERTLNDVIAASGTDAYVFRPSVVAGPESLALLTNIPYFGTPSLMPTPLRRFIDAIPGTEPMVPNPGVPLQVVHADDVADALVKAVLGEGPPGIYNLAADGTFTMKDLARELGWRSVQIPSGVLDMIAALVRRVPALPGQTEWIEAARVPVIMDTDKARRELGWTPHYTAEETIRATVDGARRAGLVDAVGRS